MLKILEFIYRNDNWEELLTQDPYNLKVRRDDDFILFSYNQISSNFYLEIVCEARGIIFHEPTWTPVCVPFYKFFNHGEKYAAYIDWESASVQEKIDGSIIKLWNYSGQWHVSTNNSIDANKAQLPFEDGNVRTFFDLFYMASVGVLNPSSLNPHYTYMFELCSPINRVVVPHQETGIFHIGTRDNRTLEEFDLDIGIKKPRRHTLRTIHDIVETVSELPYDEEGYVVVDKNWNRIKVKSPAYVAAHRLRGEYIVTEKRVFEMLRVGEQSEFLAVFPEYNEFFEDVQGRIGAVVNAAKICCDTALKTDWTNGGLLDEKESRKHLARYAFSTKFPHAIFAVFDERCSSAENWFFSMEYHQAEDFLRMELVDKPE